MGIMVSPEILRRFPLFAGIDFEILKQIAMAGEVHSVEPESWLFYEGDRADLFYLIVRGSVLIHASLGNKLAYVGVCRLDPGDVFGWSALVEPYRYQLGAVTEKKCELIQMDGVRLCELMTHHPHAGYILMTRVTGIIGQRLINLRICLASLVEGGQFQQLVGDKAFFLFEGGRSKPRD